VPTELTAAEATLVGKLQRSGKFYVFLRTIRSELFDEAFQGQLAAVYRPRGTRPIPPALLAMVLLLQGFDQVGDAEAVENATVDLRWQLVLGCLGADRAPFSQGALVAFRERLIAHDLDKALLDKTVGLAKTRGGFGWQHLRAALDSSPLLGAGRIEDTWNLIGRALQAVVTCAAQTLRVPRTQVVRAVGLTLLDAPSLKAALDIDWQDPTAQADALARLLAEVDRLEAWVAAQAALADAPAVHAALTTLRQVLTQDLEPDPTSGQRRIRRGVAVDRQPSIGDPAMRHGRKTKVRTFTGFKRHVVKLVDADVIVDAVVRPANEPEHATLAHLLPAVTAYGPLRELFIDRGYLASPTIAALDAAGVAIRAKAWTSRNGDFFPKHAFTIDLAVGRIVCPAAQTAPILPGATAVHFPASICQPCPRRAACTPSRRGRSITVHPHEALLQTLRTAQQDPAGRARLRTRTTIEHSLARVQQLQGPKARYKGLRKNTLDLRRIAVVTNLQRVARLPQVA
jgi:hypothetical protein